MEKTVEIIKKELRQEIAREIICIDHPPISGQYADAWQMFLYTRNKAMEIALDGDELNVDY